MRYELQLLLITFICGILLQVNGAPKKKSGGSGWGKKNTGTCTSCSVSGSSSKKMGALKKAAVIGGGAYVGYQLGKATSRFAHWHHSSGWGYRDYDKWRQQDGMLCRNTEDCTWLDINMVCKDYELDFTPMEGWFGGDYLSIIGDCECRYGMSWDNYELECQDSMLATASGGLMVVLVVLVCGGCGAGCVLIYCCFFKRR